MPENVIPPESPVNHAERAKALLDKIRALRAEVPRFVPDPPTSEKRRLNSKVSVPAACRESASVAVERSQRLQNAAGADAAKLRDTSSYATAYEAVVQELHAFARDMAHSIRVQLAEAGGSTLDVLAIARRLAKQKDGAELLPHVEDMQRKLNRRRTRKTTSDPVPVPLEASAPQRVV